MLWNVNGKFFARFSNENEVSMIKIGERFQSVIENEVLKVRSRLKPNLIDAI